MAKKKESIAATPTNMWMGCGYRAHLMDVDGNSNLVIILPGGQESIILPTVTAEQWEADVKKTPKGGVKMTRRPVVLPPSPSRLRKVATTTVKPVTKDDDEKAK